MTCSHFYHILFVGSEIQMQPTLKGWEIKFHFLKGRVSKNLWTCELIFKITRWLYMYLTKKYYFGSVLGGKGFILYAYIPLYEFTISYLANPVW